MVYKLIKLVIIVERFRVYPRGLEGSGRRTEAENGKTILLRMLC